MTKRTKLKVPSHLRPETKRWFREISERFVLESHHSRLLLIAAESWDRRSEAREILQQAGLTTADKYGTVKPHPCVAIERDAKNQFMRAIRELGLDIADEPVRPPSTQPRHHRS